MIKFNKKNIEINILDEDSVCCKDLKSALKYGWFSINSEDKCLMVGDLELDRVQYALIYCPFCGKKV